MNWLCSNGWKLLFSYNNGTQIENCTTEYLSAWWIVFVKFIRSRSHRWENNHSLSENFRFLRNSNSANLITVHRRYTRRMRMSLVSKCYRCNFTLDTIFVLTLPRKITAPLLSYFITNHLSRISDFTTSQFARRCRKYYKLSASANGRSCAARRTVVMFRRSTKQPQQPRLESIVAGASTCVQRA